LSQRSVDKSGYSVGWVYFNLGGHNGGAHFTLLLATFLLQMLQENDSLLS